MICFSGPEKHDHIEQHASIQLDSGLTSAVCSQADVNIMPAELSECLSFLSLTLNGFTIQRTTLYSHLLIRRTCFILLHVQEPVDEVFEFYFEGKPKFDPKLSGLESNA